MHETGRGEVEVKIAVDLALEHFRDARIRQYVMILAERDAHARLRVEAATPAGERGGVERGEERGER
jgi:hypothetical protein